MALFIQWSNNGVWVVVPEKVHREDERRREAMALARQHGQELNLPLAKPRFTFSNAQSMAGWVTGDKKMMDRLLKGHEVFQRSTFVPFSNGTECDTSGPDSMRQEQSYRTSAQELLDHFGLWPDKRPDEKEESSELFDSGAEELGQKEPGVAPVGHKHAASVDRGGPLVGWRPIRPRGH